MEHIKSALHCLLLVLISSVGTAQGLEFLDCADGSLMLCTNDEQIQLPDNNQMILGEGTPGATTCSAHWRLQQQVSSDCGIIVKYVIDYYPFDGAQKVRIQDTSEAFVNIAEIAPLTLDTKLFGTAAVQADGIAYNAGCIDDPGAFHRVQWTAINECGDIDSCSYLIRVVDCQPPLSQPVGFSTVIFPPEQVVTIIAQDFVLSAVDDCSPINWLLYSFDKAIFRPTLTLNCDSIEAKWRSGFRICDMGGRWRNR